MIDRLPDPFPDDNCARPEIFPEDTKAADLRIRREAADHSRHRGAMTINVASVSGLHLDLNSGVDDVKIMQETDADEVGMIDLDPRVDHGNSDTFARAIGQRLAGLVQSEGTGIGA